MSLDPASLIASFVFGSVGFVLFYYGKKQGRFPHMLAGGILMVFPMFVSSVLLTIGISVAILGALYLAVRAGM